MNVLILGAGGKTGEHVVKRALAAGHTVTAFVHDPGQYDAPSAAVRVVGGDAADADVLGPAVQGQHAVIDAVGGDTPYKQTGLEQRVAGSVVGAMKQHGVKRLVVVSAVGVGDSKQQATFLYEYILMPTFLRGAMKDKGEMEQAVEASGLAFTLVRPPALTDAPPTGQVRVVDPGDTARQITRADLAQFLVEQLASDAHVNQAVTVANV